MAYKRMGNVGCLSAQQVSALKDEELAALHAADEGCVPLLQQQFPGTEICKTPGLDNYQVGSTGVAAKESLNPEVLELVRLCTEDKQKPEKYQEMLNALTGEIRFLRETESSPQGKFSTSQVQALCRVYDALLREEEREKRRVVVKTKEQQKIKKEKAILPPIGRVGLDFGMSVLISIVETFGSEKPELVRKVLDVASRVVGDLEPLSISGYGDAIAEPVAAVISLLTKILNGQMSGLDQADELKTITALMGLALATGSLTACLSLAERLMHFPTNDQWKEVLARLVQPLSKLNDLKPSAKSQLTWSWNTGKVGPDIVISNEDKTITRTNSSAWGNNLSEQTVTSGIHYIEFKIDRNSSSCLLIGVAPTDFNEWGSKCSTGKVICWQADGDSYLGGSSKGNIGAYTANDKVGMLLNMEEHSVTFFKNGEKKGSAIFDVPPEVAVIICFGGSDQFVTINDDPEIPQDVQEFIKPVKKAKSDVKEEEEEEAPVVFRKTGEEIVKDPVFNLFTKGEAIGDQAPVIAALFVLASLDLQGEILFANFELDKVKLRYAAKLNFGRSSGLSLEVQGATFQFLMDVLKYIMDIYQRKAWEELSFKYATWGALCALRMLRNHIFASKTLNLTPSESGLSPDKTQSIRTFLNFFSKITLSALELESTPENTEAAEAISQAAATASIHGFELYYPTLNSQLDFVLEGLVSDSSPESGSQRIVNAVMNKISLPLNLVQALDISQEESRARVDKFLHALMEKTSQQSLAFIKGQGSMGEDLMSTFFIAMNVFFVKVTKEEVSAEAKDMLTRFVFTYIEHMQTLVDAAVELTGGKLTDDSEALLRKTLLGSHTTCFLRSLSILPLDTGIRSRLIRSLFILIPRLSLLQGGKPERVKGLAFTSEIYESDHPYANSLDATRSFEIPNAVEYVLEFDPRCRSENNYDYLELFKEAALSTSVKKWTGTSGWETRPVSFQQPALHFKFHSDGSNNDWGFRVTVMAKIPVDLLSDSWIDEVRNSASRLLVSMCRGLIVGHWTDEDNVKAVFSNKLLRAGIKDEGVLRLMPKRPDPDSSLFELAELTQTATVPLAADIPFQYCSTPILEELITGSERTIAAFSTLKAQSFKTDDLITLGGTDMDSAERALFALFLAFFELSSTFASLVDSPQEVGVMLKNIVRHVCKVRNWGQQRINAGAKSNFTEIAQDIVSKSTLLLNSDYRPALIEIGIDKVLVSLTSTVQKAAPSAEAEAGKGMFRLGAKILAKTMKGNAAIKRAQALMKLRKTKTDTGTKGQSDEGKRQFRAIYNLVLDVFASPLSAATICEEVLKRRSRALARTIGLNIFSANLPALSKGEMVGIICGDFLNAFSKGTSKVPYTDGVDGADPLVMNHMRDAFFGLYRKMVDLFSLDSIKELDCTGHSTFQNVLKLMEALCFPMEERDTQRLLEMKVRDSLELALNWAKGIHITQRIPATFDLSKCVISLAIFDEEGYEKGDYYVLSCHPINRIQGESGADDIEGQAHRIIEVTTGTSESTLLPICDVQVLPPEAELEGYERVEGNVNETGDPLFLFVKREQPIEGGKYLRKVVCTGWNPVTFDFQYEAYFATEVTSEEDQTARKLHFNLMRHCSWLLFKVFAYMNTQSESQSPARVKMLERLAELIFGELTWSSSIFDAGDSLSLRKLTSGKLWRSQEPLVPLQKNPVIEWIDKIRADGNEYLTLQKESGVVPNTYEVSLLDAVNDYIGNVDPMMKGVLEELPEGSSSVPETYKNANGQLDFFCFLKTIVEKADFTLSPFWCQNVQSSPLYQNLPGNMQEARERSGEVTVQSIINMFYQSINQNYTNSFISYLDLFRSTEPAGIVTGKLIPKATPADFLNSQGELDFFTALQAIRTNSQTHLTYFQEISHLLASYATFPASCREYYTQRQGKVQAEYQASMLLLLCQCCKSQAMLQVVARPQFLLELLKHMFMGSLKTMSIAFRIVREVMASQCSPAHVESLWNSMPKGKLRAELGSEACKGFVTILFHYIGMRAIIHSRSLKYVYTTLERIDRLGFDALSFLQTVSRNATWRDHLLQVCADLSRNVGDGSTMAGYETLVGALGYLRGLKGGVNIGIREWNKVKLVGAGITEGLLVKYTQEEPLAVILSEETGKFRKEKREALVGSTTHTVSFPFDSLPASLVNTLFSTLSQLYLTLSSSALASTDKSSESAFADTAVTRTAQCFILEVLSGLADSKHTLPKDTSSALLSTLMKGMGSQGEEPSYQLYLSLKQLLFTRHQGRIKNWMKVVVAESKFSNTVSEVEEAKLMAGYTQDQRCFATLLKSIGLSFGIIKEVISTNVTSVEAVLRLLDGRLKAKKREKAVKAATSESVQLYKLGKNEKNLAVYTGSHDKITYRESSSGQLSFSTKEPPNQPVYLLKKMEESMLDKTESPPEELTIVATLGFLGQPESATFGLVMGGIQLKCEITPNMVMQGEVMKNYSYRIFLSYTGEYKIVTDPGGQVVLEASNGFSFEDINEVKFGLFLETKGKVALKGLAIYQGHCISAVKNLFEEEGEEEEVVRGKLIDYSLKSLSPAYLSLTGVLGLQPKAASQLAATSPDFKQVLSRLYSQPVELQDFATNYGAMVQDCVFVRKMADVPAGFTPVKMYAEGEELSDYGFYGGVVAAVQMTSVKAKGYVSSIEWKNDAFVAIKDNEGKEPPIFTIYIIRTSSPKQVFLPPGFKLVTSGSKVLSLANDPHLYYFLAYSTQASVRNLPFSDLTCMTKTISDGGMVDFFPESVGEELATEVAAEVNKFAVLSGTQLHAKFARIEKSQMSRSSFQLVIKLLKRWNEGVSNPEQFSQLLEHSGSNLEELGQAITSLLQQPQLVPIIAQALLLDILAQLCTACTQTSTSTEVSKRVLNFESTHPYDNNMDKREVISVPGAYRMVFTFVPECKSENNYDYLLFSKDAAGSEQIAKQTGSAWPGFEFEGNTVYTLFHSDGSNNDWGYKFKVEAYVRGAVSSFFGAKRAIWLLESIFFTEPKLAEFIPRFLGKELANALAIFVHSTGDPELSLKALSLLKKILQLSSDHSSNSQAIVDVVASEVVALYTEEEKKSKKSDFLKASVSFATELKEKYEFAMDAEWYSSFFDNFCFLRGFVNKDEHFQYMLLKQFLQSRGKSLDVARESPHPYPNNAFSTKEISIRGAKFIDVALSEDFETRPQESILFSLDPSGTRPFLPKFSSSGYAFNWNDSVKGPNIAISNEGKTVTRTDSSGWGSAIFDGVYREGGAKIRVKIDNDGGSTYLYIGVVEERPTYNLNSCVYKDYEHRAWVYKVTGEVHKKSQSVENLTKYATNDEIAIELDYDAHTVTFFKNDQQVHQFDDLDVPVTGIACFGGSNQIISLVGAEALERSSKKAGANITIPGERFYYHFPVHIGYMNMVKATWKAVSNPALNFAKSGKSVSRSGADTSLVTLYTTNQLKAERNLTEFKVSDLGTDTVITIGVGLIGESLIMSYSNKGVLQKGSETGELEPFKSGDTIAILYNLTQNEFRIYKNESQVSGIIRIPLEAGKEYHFGISFNGEARVDILEASRLTELVDLIGKSIAPGRGAFNKYGYKFTASPTYIGKNKRYVFETLGELEGDWQRYYSNQKSLFSAEVCEQLVSYLDETTQEKDPTALRPEDITLQTQDLARFGLLKKLTGDEIRSIFSLLKDLNLKVVSMLPLISLDLAENPQFWNELQATFINLRNYLFFKRKQALLKDITSKSVTTERPALVIDKSLAERSRESKEPDSIGAVSYFGQTWKTFRAMPNKTFRNEERFFQPNLGEGQLDTQDAYNEVIDEICGELHSNFLPLYVPCPNAVHSLGDNRDTWVPNPAADSALQISMFEFLGKLFGVAVRTKRPLKLALSPLFWKRLQFAMVQLQDLKQFDEGTYQTLDMLRHLEDHGIDSRNFSNAYSEEYFTTIDSGSRTIELIPGGASIPLTYENYRQYAELLEQQRLREAARVYTAIRRGMSAVIPVHLFHLLTWKQAETLICGETDFDSDRLREKTTYEGYTNSSPVIGFLWETLRECKPIERCAFLRFVWARNRLPKTEVPKFKIAKKPCEDSPNDLPMTSSALAFTLYLPEYSSKDVFKDRFMTAILQSQPSDLETIHDAEETPRV